MTGVCRSSVPPVNSAVFSACTEASALCALPMASLNMFVKLFRWPRYRCAGSVKFDIKLRLTDLHKSIPLLFTVPTGDLQRFHRHALVAFSAVTLASYERVADIISMISSAMSTLLGH